MSGHGIRSRAPPKQNMNWPQHDPGSLTSLGEPHTRSGSPTPTAWLTPSTPLATPLPTPTGTSCGTRRRTTVYHWGPSNCNRHSPNRTDSSWTHNLSNNSSATKHDGPAAPRQPSNGFTWSVPASTSHRARQNVRRKRCNSTRAIYLDPAFPSQSPQPIELTALDHQTLLSSN